MLVLVLVLVLMMVVLLVLLLTVLRMHIDEVVGTLVLILLLHLVRCHVVGSFWSWAAPLTTLPQVLRPTTTAAPTATATLHPSRPSI